MKIIPYHEKYLDELARLFVDVYHEPGKQEWNQATAKRYLLQNTFPSIEYCFVAIDDQNQCLGGILGKRMPYGTGDYLFIDTLQIKKEYWQMGIGKALMKTLLEKAHADKLHGVLFLADSRKKFPQAWYKKVGFSPSGWADFSAKMEEIQWKNL